MWSRVGHWMGTASSWTSSSPGIGACRCRRGRQYSLWRVRPAGDGMIATVGGVHGRLLRVDLRDNKGAGWTEPIEPAVFADVIGGIGLASLLLLRLCPPGADPLGPDNPLIFATSSFAGTGITTSSKIAVAARSPQTGMIGDSLSSSYLALELKRTGHDALAITGCAPDWSVLVIVDGKTHLRPADGLLGLSPGETADHLRAELGTEFRVAAIGTAGEHGVRYAAISGETLRLEHHTGQHACAACTVGCEHHYRTRDSGPETSARLEYETLFALGSLCGVSDPNVVLRASALCDELGMDAISAGGTIAWAMECRERGVDLGVPKDEIPRWGDGTAVLRTLRRIGAREGLGDLLAEGSRAAAERVGQGSDVWAMHVKGLELPGYDPRKLKTLALGLAVAARGACHNRSSAYEVDLSDRLDPEADARERAAAAAAAEDQAALLDSLTLCKFLRHALHDVHEESAALHRAVTGLATTVDDLHQAGVRIGEVKKRFNLAQGWTRALDTLPPRLLQSSSSSNGDESNIDPAWLKRQIDAYYAARGWDSEGRPMETAVGV